MLVLGIDPGLETTGYGLVEEAGGRLRALDFGVIRTVRGQSLSERLLVLHRGVERLVAEREVAAVAIEELFFRRNVTSAIAVGQARGVIVLAVAERGLPLWEYTPAQVKQAVTGYGRADKEQIGRVLQLLLGLETVPRPDDAGDALGVAICHLNHRRIGALG